MGYIWTDNWSTGDYTIDDQHKELVGAVNALLDACSDGSWSAQIGSTIDFLKRYAQKHFSDEEAMWRERRYPELDAHRRLHDEFKVDLASVCDELEKSGPTQEIVMMVNEKVGEWLINHILTEDKRAASETMKNAT